jgi:hypothetical protein
MSSSTKPSSSSSSSTKASNAPLKSYWYPDRRAELGEVREGYQLRSHLSLLLAIVGVPVIAGVVATYGAQHATAQEMLRNVRASIHALQQQEDKEVLVPLARAAAGRRRDSCAARGVFCATQSTGLFARLCRVHGPRQEQGAAVVLHRRVARHRLLLRGGAAVSDQAACAHWSRRGDLHARLGRHHAARAHASPRRAPRRSRCSPPP